MPTGNNFDKNIFINCPFDDEYKHLLQALLFTLIWCGYEPRIASERSDSLEVRLTKIQSLIRESKYSIHDLSRMKSSEAGEFARFNLPFELGVDFGCRIYGDTDQQGKRCLILSEGRYDHQISISDLAGVDVGFHKAEPENLVRTVRKWIRTELNNAIEYGSQLWNLYNEYQGHLGMAMEDEGCDEKDREDMSDVEFMDLMRAWIQDKKSQ